jgi:nucleoside-diphosphate-sugar epimerase
MARTAATSKPKPKSKSKSKSKSGDGLTVAVTGPTGTFGFGLLPLLEADDRIDSIVGVARRPFDPAAHGWHKMTYRRGDVRHPDVLAEAFEGADVVVHLAFMITGSASREMIREINVDGTLNAFRAAAAAGAKRFVYASSVAAYGFHRDNPIGMTEEWPTRPAARLFCAQEKAELEELIGAEAHQHPELGLYLLRPPIVLGPHALGAKELPGLVAAIGRAGNAMLERMPLPLPVPVPNLPMQLIHEDDVGAAFLGCIAGVGPPGSYNIAAEGQVTGADIARELGLTPLSIPGGLSRAGARLLTALPGGGVLPPITDWVEAASHPSIMDTSKAKELLAWSPRFTALESLQATINPDD